MVAFIVTSALVVLLFAVNSYAFFWYEAANGDHLDKLRGASGNQIRRWLTAAVASAWISALIVLVTFPWSFLVRRRRPVPDAKSSKPAVFLIHGLYHNAGAWLFYRRYLHRCGYRNVVLFDYGSWNTDFYKIVDRCEEELEATTAAFRQSGVLIVGHSLGGLIALKAIAQAGPKPEIKGLVTLGTPFHGSRLAVLAPGRLGRSIQYRGPLAKEIETADSGIATPRLAVYSLTDNIVLPNNALLPYHEQWETAVTGPVSHVGLLYHPRVMVRVRHFLDRCSNTLDNRSQGDERGST